MKIVILGDIHTKWNPILRIVEHELSKGDIAVSTGDLTNYTPYMPRNQVPLYFIGGNHEHRWSIEQMLIQDNPLMKPLLPGIVYTTESGLSVAGLSGIYHEACFKKPITETRINKYYSDVDLEAMMNITQPVDILLTHEAPEGLIFDESGKDIGRPLVTELVQKIAPKYHFCGHHHELKKGAVHNTIVFSMGKPNSSYILIENGELKVVTATMQKKNKGYAYEWEK